MIKAQDNLELSECNIGGDSIRCSSKKCARIVTTTLACTGSTMVHSAMRQEKASNLELTLQIHYNYPEYIVFGRFSDVSVKSKFSHISTFLPFKLGVDKLFLLL